MSLFGAALKVVVCIKQRPDPTEKRWYLLPGKQTINQAKTFKCSFLGLFCV